MGAKPFPIATEYSKGVFKEDSGLLLPEGASPNSIGVTEIQNMLRRNPGVSKLSTDIIVGTLKLIYQAKKADNSAQMLFVTSSGLYKYVFGASPEFTSIATWTADEATVYAESFGDKVLIANGSYNIKLYNWSTVADCGGLTGVNAEIVKTFFTHMVLFKVTESAVRWPSRVKWSVIGNPELYTGSGSGYLDLLDTNDEIANAELLGDKLIIYKDFSIWTLSHVGLPKVFSANPLMKDVGLYAPKSLVSANNQHFFMGTDDIYQFSLGGIKRIGEGIKSLLFGINKDFDTSSKSAVIGWYDIIMDEYCLAYPTVGNTVPKRILRYSIKKSRWFTDEIPYGLRSVGYYKYPSGYPWTSLSGAWTAQTPSWDNIAETYKGLLLLYGTDYIYYQDLTKVDWNSIYPNAYWDTRDITSEESTRFSEYNVEARGLGTIELSYSINEGTSWTSLGQRTITANWDSYSWFLNITHRVIRFRVTFGNTIGTEIRRQKVWVIPKPR